MAYFPNGSAGMMYVDEYCEHCINWRDNGSGSEGCYIQDLHSLWNYDACNGKDAPKGSVKRTQWVALEHFIPTTKDGLGAEQCKMFIPANDMSVVIDKTDALKEWEKIYGKRVE
jgi:hypothetical protein